MVIDVREPTWCIGSTLTWNATDVGSSPALGTIFLVFIKPMALVSEATRLRCMVIEPTLCMYIRPLPVCNCK